MTRLLVLLVLLLTACATPAPFYYCQNILMIQGDKMAAGLECVPRIERMTVPDPDARSDATPHE